MNAQDIQRLVAQSVELKQRFFPENASLLLEVGGLMADSLRAGGRVLAFGNGGSASDAQHFVAELVGRLARERRGLSAIALTTDPSVVTEKPASPERGSASPSARATCSKYGPESVTHPWLFAGWAKPGSSPSIRNVASFSSVLFPAESTAT